jgi:CcmD family protein
VTIAAYVFVWVATIVYTWSVWRRMDRIAGEMRALDRRR